MTPPDGIRQERHISGALAEVGDVNKRSESSSGSEHAPVCVRMASHVCPAIHATIMSLPHESGGLLLGPKGGDEITDFHFDVTGGFGSSTYTPDHVALNELMRDRWIPAGPPA